MCTSNRWVLNYCVKLLTAWTVRSSYFKAISILCGNNEIVNVFLRFLEKKKNCLTHKNKIAWLHSQMNCTRNRFKFTGLVFWFDWLHCLVHISVMLLLLLVLLLLLLFISFAWAIWKHCKSAEFRRVMSQCSMKWVRACVCGTYVCVFVHSTLTHTHTRFECKCPTKTTSPLTFRRWHLQHTYHVYSSAQKTEIIYTNHVRYTRIEYTRTHGKVFFQFWPEKREWHREKLFREF